MIDTVLAEPPAISVAEICNGSLLTERPEAAVPWWSFSKSVLGAAALSLVRDRLIELDAPLTLQLAGALLPAGRFTLRQLLRHEAGLADYAELPDYHAAVARDAAPWPANEMLLRLDADRLRYPPGEGWRYSNVGYLSVARLIEHLTGLTLEAALAQRVFAPLGLSKVRLAQTRADLQGVNMGDAVNYDPGWVYHGLLVGPVEEAAQCLDRLLGGDLLPASLLREMQTVRTLGGPIIGRPWTSPGYGLGLMHGPIEDGRVLSGHTGAGPGSVIAVYRCCIGKDSATCAIFSQRSDQGHVEATSVQHLSRILRSRTV